MISREILVMRRRYNGRIIYRVDDGADDGMDRRIVTPSRKFLMSRGYSTLLDCLSFLGVFQ